jgi:ABC-type lipoprotein release transport system permease subunit
MTIFTVAWRNIWRNKRRTIITSASVTFAVFFAVIMRSMEEGTYDRMLNNVIQMYIGHLQIHARGYWDDKSLESLFEYNDTVQKAVAAIPQVQKTYKHLETFAFVSTGELTKVTAFLGIEPEKEYQSLHIKTILTAGSFITKNDRSIILAEGLADYLKVITYDTIITKQKTTTDTILKPRIILDSVAILSQGYRGESAVAMFRVKGVVKLFNPDLNKRMVYAPLELTQSFLSAPNMLSSLSIIVEDKNDIPAIKQLLKKELPQTEYEIMTWDQMLVELVQQIESDRGSGIIMMLILYALIGFGIFGTIVMLTNERKKEFAVMLSIGMQKSRLIRNLLIELLYMGLIGVAIGSILSLPFLVYWYYHPIRFYGEIAKVTESYGWEAIMPVTISSIIFMWQAIVVLVMYTISAIYPVNRIRKMDPVKALRE